MSYILGPGLLVPVRSFSTLHCSKMSKILNLVHILILVLEVSLKIDEVIQCILCFCNSLSITQVHTLINLSAKGSLGPCLKSFQFCSKLKSKLRQVINHLPQSKQDQNYFNPIFPSKNQKQKQFFVNKQIHYRQASFVNYVSILGYLVGQKRAIFAYSQY